MANYGRHDEEVKAACLAALLTGQSVTETAKQYNLKIQTVSRWNVESRNNGKKSETIDELIEKLLISSFRTLLAQQEVLSDVEYLRTQSLSENAVAHGIVYDKTIRILEAAERANELYAQRLINAENEDSDL